MNNTHQHTWAPSTLNDSFAYWRCSGCGTNVDELHTTPMPTLEWADAVRLVATDVNANGWDEGPLTGEDAVAYVRDTMRLPEEPYVPGSYPLDDDGTPLATAYRMVLTDAD